ncbi:hypothetical protein [Mycolicibacterium palauense]|uniref:hypothetical protein n=1 Tax=Mycolicibacterium palauense TaxID=2034511 RepID=UPI000BFF074B|nr:hypothetical protein [Mycolicibacterium palauense]
MTEKAYGGGAAKDGSMSEVPWALVFDPAANVRALGEIQARGFRAAAELVDRFVNLSDRRSPSPEQPQTAGAPESHAGAGPESHAGAGPESRAGAGPESRADTRPEVDRLVASWKGIVEQLAGSLRGTVTANAGGAPSVDLSGAAAHGRVDLSGGVPGAAGAEVWLHNPGATDHGTVELRSGDLLAHDGNVIDAARVSFDPAAVPMPARCSRGVTIRVDIAENTAPGSYHGTLLVAGHPDLWLPLVVTVAEPA